MPIERGVDWGWEADERAEWRVCADDTAVAEAIEAGVELVRVDSGDLARTLGLSSSGRSHRPSWHVPIDALSVSIDGEAPVIAVAHVLIGSWLNRSGWTAVLNAAFVGDQNLAPRAHPGDGYADVVTSSVRGADRFKARKRARTGTHVPHPAISIRRVEQLALDFDTTRAVRIDGRPARRARSLEVTVLPGAIVIAI